MAVARAQRVASAGDFGDEGRAVKAPRVGVRRKSEAPPGATDHKEREAAVDRWVKVLDELRIPGAVQVKVGQIRMAVVETTAAKATATLNLRSSSWLMFLKWVRDGGRILHPLEPEVVEEYLREAARAAATRGTRLLEAMDCDTAQRRRSLVGARTGVPSAPGRSSFPSIRGQMLVIEPRKRQSQEDEGGRRGMKEDEGG